MKKKNLISLILAAALVLCLAACGGESTEASAPASAASVSAESSAAVEAPAEAAEAAPAEASEAVPEAAPEGGGIINEDGFMEFTQGDANIVVTETDDYAVTFDGFAETQEEYENHMIVANFTVTTKNTETKFSYGGASALVDGLAGMVTNGNDPDAGASASMEYKVRIEPTFNVASGFGTYATFTMNIKSYDELNPAERIKIALYPQGKAAAADYEVDLSGAKQVLDNETAAVYYMGGNEAGTSGFFYFVNKTDKPLYFISSDFIFNGTQTDAAVGTYIPAGGAGFDDVYLDDATLGAVGIASADELTAIDFTLVIEDGDTDEELYNGTASVAVQ